jgi:hypothetical protein
MARYRVGVVLLGTGGLCRILLQLRGSDPGCCPITSPIGRMVNSRLTARPCRLPGGLRDNPDLAGHPQTHGGLNIGRLGSGPEFAGSRSRQAWMAAPGIRDPLIIGHPTRLVARAPTHRRQGPRLSSLRPCLSERASTPDSIRLTQASCSKMCGTALSIVTTGTVWYSIHWV